MQDTPDSSIPPLTVIAFDFGLRRIGAAVGQAVTASASPLGVAGNGEMGPDWDQIRIWIDEWRPDRLIVGLPLNADGSESTLVETVRAFAADLARFGLEIGLVDERYSSREAEEALKSARASGRRGRIDKKQIDALAAVIIAERWLNENS